MHYFLFCGDSWPQSTVKLPLLMHVGLPSFSAGHANTTTLEGSGSRRRPARAAEQPRMRVPVQTERSKAQRGGERKLLHPRT